MKYFFKEKRVASVLEGKAIWFAVRLTWDDDEVGKNYWETLSSSFTYFLCPVCLNFLTRQSSRFLYPIFFFASFFVCLPTFFLLLIMILVWRCDILIAFSSATTAVPAAATDNKVFSLSSSIWFIRDLLDKDVFSRSDPICIVYTQPVGLGTGNSHWMELLRTEVTWENGQ